MEGGFRGEGYPGFGPEKGIELEALLANPEQVFDSDLNEAKNQSDQVVDRLKLLGEVRRERWVDHKRIEFITQREDTNHQVPSVQIIWLDERNREMMLHLSPVEESGKIAFIGSYGIAKENKKGYEFVKGKKVPLEELFNAPSGTKILVRPTMTRWCIGKDDLVLAFGENTATLYMGLGFLFLGHQYMHIGNHEGGHLKKYQSGNIQREMDENKAWTRSNRTYAEKHKLRKRKIISGQSTGLFELLKKPVRYGDEITIGKIMKWGLVSHRLANNARIPQSWESKKGEITKELKDVIYKAHEAFEFMLKQ